VPPRSRAQIPTTRRPRVAGLRDPRRHEDVEEPTTTIRTAPDAADPTAEPSDATVAAGPEAPVGVDDPTSTTDTHDAGTAPVSLTKGDGAGPAPTAARARTRTTTTPAPEQIPVPEQSPAPPPTPAARPTPTGRARTERRRPAPATGAAGTHGRTHARRRTVTSTRRRAHRSAPPWTAAVLGVLVVVFAGVAGVAGWLGHQAWTSGPAANSAVVDAATTAEVVGQARQGVEQVFSFDPAKIEDSADAARTLGTGDFPREYLQVFDQSVRQAAVQQGLRQSASVLDIGVRSIAGDRANVVALIQLDVQRASTGQSTTTPGLLTIDLQRVDGRWKLAKVSPLTGQS